MIVKTCKLIWDILSWNNGLLVRALDYKSRSAGSKSLGGSKFDSAFHCSEFDEMTLGISG